MIGHHAFGDQYKETDFFVPGLGKLEVKWTPSNGGEALDFTFFDFENSGGVAMAVYSTDKVNLILSTFYLKKFINNIA